MAKQGKLAPTRPDAEEIELNESFWKQAKWMPPLFPRKASVHLRIDNDVLDWFKAQGKGHLTRMNAVLRAYAYSEMNRKRPAKRAASRTKQQKKTRPS